jgi:cytochrome bd ubiquinol oxidase subunit I
VTTDKVTAATRGDGRRSRTPAVLMLIAQALGPVEQEYLLEARQMQALSFAVHIPLVCFGVAFPGLVLTMEWLGRRRGDALLLALARRWSKAMIGLFAVGVVTGTILSFELGLLWPEFMATYGDVFGLAFALEGFSFFVEAIFIAIYVYGWERLSPRAHMLAGIPVAIAGFTGSLMVISVNGWMNHPSGFRLENGRAVDVEPFDALFGNAYFWHEMVHMYLAAFLVAGFVTASVYAVAALRGRRDRYVRVAMAVPLLTAAVVAPAQVIVGDWAAREVAKHQPTKLAAFEGLGRTQTGAPLHLGGWYDAETNEVRNGLAIPRALSLLAFHDPNARVQGLDRVPPEDRPPVNVVRVAFFTMVGIGTLMALFGVWLLIVWWRRRTVPDGRWFLRAVAAFGPLSIVALIAGWVTTEVGRQPWVVYGRMRTEDAVTGAGGIPLGYAALVVIYVALALATAWLLRRLARSPLEVGDGAG